MRLAKLQDGSRWRADRFCTKGGWIDSWAEGKVKSFYELHELLGFEYHVEQSGGLYGFSDGSFQLVVSAGGLEHVKEDAVPTLIAETERILEPNGWALHSIDTSDHLAHYDKSVPRKLYLSFSKPPWHRLFENKVQYVNRIQRGDWLRLMENKFELIEEESNQTDISRLKLTARYSQLPKKDLECTVLQMLLRKPVAFSTRLHQNPTRTDLLANATRTAMRRYLSEFRDNFLSLRTGFMVRSPQGEVRFTKKRGDHSIETPVTGAI